MKDPENRIMKLWTISSLLFIGMLFLGLTIIFISYTPSAFLQDKKPDTTQWKPRSVASDLPPDQRADTIYYGYQLITNSARWIGPRAQNASKRFAGNNLSCSNCHLAAGRKIGSGSFVGVSNRYPQFRGRENKMGSIEERINGCMERSMNGKPLPENSAEMRAIVAYMEWLSEDVPEHMQALYQGYVKINLPHQRADTLKGRLLYEDKCQICHGENGKGTPKPGPTFSGYLYPPLGGDDSFNDGAGMNRIITAAEFIKGNMPFGATPDAPIVSDEEAYHIAAYINSLPRPSKPGKEADFPDLTLKPVSTPYGPYADDFSPEQHTYGPFQPIMDFYKEKYGIRKSN